MPALNEKPVRLLMKDMAADMRLKHGDVFTREQAVAWFRVHYPNVKEGTVAAHLIRLSTNAPARLHYNAKADGSEDTFYKIDGSRFRLYEAGKDSAPIVEGSSQQVQIAKEGSEADEGSEFAYEHDLRDYLARNLGLIEHGLTLYSDEGISGVEFPAGSRFIDILALDKDKNYVVIELKVSRGYDRTVGQLLRYMGWIEQHHAEPGRSVRGVIVAKEISEDLKLACRRLSGIGLFEYDLSVTLRAAGITGLVPEPHMPR
ncbi:MAG: endonuclease NucS domain-containing protein [Gemmatimonadales bacterium]